MKQAIIDFARRLHVYNLLRHNRVFHGFERWTKPEARDEYRCRVQHLREFIGRTPFLAFDVGANIGQFTAPLLRLGARVVAVEPDPDAAEILRVRFWARRNVAIEQYAVSDQPGVATFYRQHPGSQRNTLRAEEIASVGGAAQVCEVKLTTLDALIARHGAPFFLKIDVEGHEFSVLQGLRIPPPRVMFECNTPSACAEGVRCVNRLHDLSADYRFGIAHVGSVAPQAWLAWDEIAAHLKPMLDPVDIFARLGG